MGGGGGGKITPRLTTQIKEMFAENIWSMKFEKIINFVDSWAISHHIMQYHIILSMELAITVPFNSTTVHYYQF